MATHSSVLAWRISGMAEPGGLPSVGSHRVGHDWGDLAAIPTSSLPLKTYLEMADRSGCVYYFDMKSNSKMHLCM